MDYIPVAPPSPPAVNKQVALVDDKEYNFIFPIPKYPSITRTKIYSPYHKFGGYRWRLFLYPQGNATKSYLSVYLECGGPVSRSKSGDRESGDEPPQWSVPVHFYIYLIHPSRWMEVGVSTDDLRRYTKDKISTWLKQSEPIVPSAAAEVRRNSSANPARKNGAKNWLKKKDKNGNDAMSNGYPYGEQDSAAVVRRHSSSGRRNGKKSKLITPRQDSSWLRQESTWLKQIKKQDDSISNISSNSNGVANRWPPHKLQQQKSLDAHNSNINMEESPFHSSTKLLPHTRNDLPPDTKSWLKQIENMDDITGHSAFPYKSGLNKDIVDDTAHVFNEKERDWGFCEFAPFTLLQPSSHCDASYNFVIKVRIRLNESALQAPAPKPNSNINNNNIVAKIPPPPSGRTATIPPPPSGRTAPIPPPPGIKAKDTIGALGDGGGIVNAGALVKSPLANNNIDNITNVSVKALKSLKAKQSEWNRAYMDKITVKEMGAMLAAFLINYEEDAVDDFTKIRAKLERLFRGKYINAAMFVEGKEKHIDWLSNLILDQVCEGDKDTRVSLEFSLERFFRLVQTT